MLIIHLRGVYKTPQTCGPDFPVALGVIRDVEAESYDEAVINQIQDVKSKSKIKSVDDLIDSCEQWEM